MLCVYNIALISRKDIQSEGSFRKLNASNYFDKQWLKSNHTLLDAAEPVGTHIWINIVEEIDYVQYLSKVHFFHRSY